MMLHTIYQGSIPCGFRKEDVVIFFSIQAYLKHVTPAAGLFLPQGHNLNKFGRGPLDDVTNQLSMLLFQTRMFFL